MDKNAIKKYAVWARNELIARVTQKAEQYEITEKKMTPKDADSINGRLLTDAEKKQRQALIAKINHDGFDQVMEEVAYTWFNRFTALRFMEVNNYLPSHTRVFTNEAGEFKPQILADAIQLDLKGMDMDKVFELKDANKTEELYNYLLITQCNALSAVLPRMFQKIEHYTELLLPDYLLREGSVIEKMITDLPESNFNLNDEEGQVEIIGWLYQYYISEKHEKVVNAIGKDPVSKENIPAATQLFTPDWIVQYIVDNSLGKYWIERHPQSELKSNLKFYLGANDDAHRENESVTPQTLTLFDPCVGSGHFLAYAFDVLLKIYTEYGFSEREAASEIVKNNLYGVDIDERAAQLAYFSLMMKARQHDRRFFSRGVQPNIYAIEESNHIDVHLVDYFCNTPELKRDIKKLLDTMRDAKAIGSLVYVPNIDFNGIFKRLQEIEGEISLYREGVLESLRPIIKVAKVLSEKYDVVATNPPYLNKLDSSLKDYVNSNFKAYSGDLFSVFMYRSFGYCKNDGYSGFMTPNVWMFISSYKALREYLIENKSISSCVQLAKGSFFKEATVDICAFVMHNARGTIGTYVRLENFKGDMNAQKQALMDALNTKCDYRFYRRIEDFRKIEDSPFAYWLSDRLTNIFETALPLKAVAEPKVGLQTGNNDTFLRLWFEPDFSHIGFNMHSLEEAKESGRKWFPYNKGGDYRRWYGNRSYIVDWQDDGYGVRHCFNEAGKLRSRPQNTAYYFKPSITWSDLTSASFSGRYCEGGFIFDVKGSSGFPEEKNHLYLLGFLNSKISQECIHVLNPTMSTQVGDMARIPVYIDEEKKALIDKLVLECVELSKEDWDSFEQSWDFKEHPLVRLNHNIGLVSSAYEAWNEECNNRFRHLKQNEEELNRLFIEIYGLQNEIEPTVDEKDITINKANLGREIRSLISYAVGCMFGRYSLDEKGLVYAGGQWEKDRYKKFVPDQDAILPISDDEYFEDDIVNKFVNFIETVYGSETKEDNLQFIAKALGGKGSSRDVIRNYFLSEFYSDHCATYSITGSGKRPIYWLYDSGKKNGFKCLVYMHRYHADTIARIRTDYVHEQQSRYRTAITDLENRINGADASERVKLNKRLSDLKDQASELREYEEKIHHLADQMISINLDDGVKHNYEIFKDVLAKIK